MIELLFATNNLNKVREIQAGIGKQIRIITLQDAGINIDIPEPHDTLEANASEKSRTIYQMTKKNCFGEDTGLEVEALNGEPGVKSARYAGDEKDFDKNIDLLLKNLSAFPNRQARFRTVISLIFYKKEYYFEGVCEGQIIEVKRGIAGFGYDPIFLPTGSNRTFAEMDLSEKNLFSHRKKAADGLVLFLQQQLRNTRTN